MKDGRVAVQIGEGTFRLGIYLVSTKQRQPQRLRSIVPAEITGGPGLAPIAVQLSADEIREALAKLQEPPKK